MPEGWRDNITNPVLNKLVESDIDVRITVTGLTNTWTVPLIRTGTAWNFVWRNTWVIPAETVGRWVYFRFRGMIDDVACDVQAHAESNDPTVHMGHYQANIAMTAIEKVVNKETNEETPIYAGVDTVLELRALPKPVNAGWPYGQPWWRVVNGPPGYKNVVISPSSGSDEVTVSGFSVPGEYEIEAGTCNGKVSIKVVALKFTITRVPYDYYAGSKSWFPFKFKVEGTSLPVKITKGKINFHIGNILWGYADLLERPFKPENGTASEYLAVANEAMFDKADTAGTIISNTPFIKLTGVSGTIDGKSFGPCDSGQSSSFSFGDKTIQIVEIGKNIELSYRQEDTREDDVDMPVKSSFYYIDGRMPIRGPYEIANPNDLPWYGYDAWDAGLTLHANGYTHHSMLYDDLDWGTRPFSFWNYCEARSFDHQLGVYWVAFRNQVHKDAPGNPFGVPVVGVIWSHPGSITLFKGGSLRYEIKCEGKGAKVLSRSFEFTDRALNKAKAFVASPVISIMSGAVWIVRKLIDISNEFPVSREHPDMVEIVAYKTCDLADGDKRPVGKELLREWRVGAGSIQLDIGEPSFVMTVNTTYRAYLSTSTNVRCMSRYFYDILTEAKLDVDIGDGKLQIVWHALPPELVNKIACDD